jgi:hypothetical protein
MSSVLDGLDHAQPSSFLPSATPAAFKAETRGRKARDRVGFPGLPDTCPAVFDVAIRQTGSATSCFDSKRARMVLKTGLQRVLANVVTGCSLPDALTEAVRRDLSKAYLFSVNAGFATPNVYLATETEALTVMCGASFHTIAGILPPSSRKQGIVPPLSSDHSYFNNVTFEEACVLAIFANLVNRLTLTDRPILLLESSCQEAMEEAANFAAYVTDALMALADKAKQRWSGKLGRGGGRVPDFESAEEYPAVSAAAAEVPKTKKRQRSADAEGSMSQLLFSSAAPADVYTESVLPISDADQCLFDEQCLFNEPPAEFDHVDAIEPSFSAEPLDTPSHRQTAQKPQYTIVDVESHLLINIYTLGWSARDVTAQLNLWAFLYNRPAPVLDHGHSFKDVVQSLMQFVRDIAMPYEVASHYVACWEHAYQNKSV